MLLLPILALISAGIVLSATVPDSDSYVVVSDTAGKKCLISRYGRDADNPKQVSRGDLPPGDFGQAVRPPDSNDALDLESHEHSRKASKGDLQPEDFGPAIRPPDSNDALDLDSHEHLADGSTTPKKGEESAMRIIKPSQSSLDKKTSTEDLSDLTDPGDRATKDPEKSVDHQQPEASRTATYSDVVPDDFNLPSQVTCHVLRAFLYLFKNWREPLAFCILFYILYLVPLMKRAGIY
ncbi:hypothetical protein PSTG_08543 [Puccinia striiformis f. sp. tritici PST-78]|uniref:Uncharacterized protein n=1 Tax=Puccinia striiformis f. sp. tritici PST-78 TaxID=1165861 RepID=A0A0L0VGW8_9BASI|nr:hypothetical protein PSTG_08543 [Puccinia striiformis f. sp. tritici PST-78]